MADIVRKNFYDAVAFEAVEKWEYIFYALEAHEDKTYPGLLARVLNNHLSQLKEYAEILPGFREEVFTHELEKWAEDYLEEQKHVLVK